MAFTTILFENQNTGKRREAPAGFSWTTFFFGFFPPLCRGDWKYAVIMLLAGFITWGFSSLVFMFIYNTLYIKGLINDGYKVTQVKDGTIEQVSARLRMSLPVLKNRES